MNGESAFGVEHGGEVSKAEDHRKRNTAVVGGGAGLGTAAVLGGTKMPEHSHYSAKTRKHLASLEPGVHEVPTEMLRHRPRKLGARKQQTPYVAAMAQERPEASFRSSPVPITRYKDGIIQRDNAHSVMANAMKGRKTHVLIEDAPGYRPHRRTGEELVRRGQMRYQQHRLKQNFNLSEKKIEAQRSKYKASSRKANTAKRPHGQVEEGFKSSKKPYSFKTAVPGAAKALKLVRKDNKDRRQVAAGAAGAAGVGTLASTPMRRSAAVVDVSGGSMSAKDARKVVSPGVRPGNKKAIKTMAANLGHLENSPTTVIRYKGGHVIPFDGNHRATARIARGDKKVPVKVVQGGERPAVSVARNAYHVGAQKVHQARMDRGAFTPSTKPGKGYTGRHTGETKVYRSIANASPSRSGRRVNLGATRFASGPTKAMLRTRQGATVLAGGALLGTAEHLHRKKA